MIVYIDLLWINSSAEKYRFSPIFRTLVTHKQYQPSQWYLTQTNYNQPQYVMVIAEFALILICKSGQGQNNSLYIYIYIFPLQHQGCSVYRKIIYAKDAIKLIVCLHSHFGSCSCRSEYELLCSFASSRNYNNL